MFFSAKDLLEYPGAAFRMISVRTDDHVFYIRLQRAAKRNAFTPTMVRELVYALEYAHQDADTWCIVIEAEGPVFCAGMDLRVFEEPNLDEVNPTLPVPVREINLGEAFRNLTKPSIAVVAGDVYAGGFLIIAGCTFVLASETVRFSLPEVKRGLFPMQVMASLTSILPPRKVLELCILARVIPAMEAFDIGLVTHLCSPEDLASTREALIAEILRNSPYAITKGMEALKAIQNMPPAEVYPFLVEKLNELKGSGDAAEGIKAFKEKREAKWENR